MNRSRCGVRGRRGVRLLWVLSSAAQTARDLTNADRFPSATKSATSSVVERFPLALGIGLVRGPSPLRGSG